MKKRSSSGSRRLTAVSLFASSGIGDLGLRAAGTDVLVANEFAEDRGALFSANFPDTDMIVGDVRELSETIVSATLQHLGDRNLDILFATPPCQGMSKNGRGKLLRGVRDGIRESLDARNQLATYVPPIVKALKPRLVVFENVPEMDGTLVEDEHGVLVELLALLASEMPDYVGVWRVIEFADFGVPERRQRLITVFVRADIAEQMQALDPRVLAPLVFPEPTHARTSTLLQKPWVTVDEVIGHLPPLDAGSSATARDKALEFHYVPLLDERKYWWVSNTPPGGGAFNNQCVNEECGFTGNPTHGSDKSTGINRSRTDTPIFCSQCGSLLPRPVVQVEGAPRIMKGFTSAYKRMRGDLPASALTRNLSYACSDQKIHPSQNRVLSLLEAMMLHTIASYDYLWVLPSGCRASDRLIMDSIGESIPPQGLEVLFRHMFRVALTDSDLAYD